MSFNTFARKVRDPKHDVWMRWSNIHSCMRHVLGGKTFHARREELFGAWKIGPGNPPTHEQLTSVLDAIVAERNLQLEKLRVYERRRVREKLRGRRVPASR